MQRGREIGRSANEVRKAACWLDIVKERDWRGGCIEDVGYLEVVRPSGTLTGVHLSLPGKVCASEKEVRDWFGLEAAVIALRGVDKLNAEEMFPELDVTRSEPIEQRYRVCLTLRHEYNVSNNKS
jgi:hypothetical protein